MAASVAPQDLLYGSGRRALSDKYLGVGDVYVPLDKVGRRVGANSQSGGFRRHALIDELSWTKGPPWLLGAKPSRTKGARRLVTAIEPQKLVDERSHRQSRTKGAERRHRSLATGAKRLLVTANRTPEAFTDERRELAG